MFSYFGWYIQTAKSDIEWLEKTIKRLEAEDLLLRISGKKPKNSKEILQAEDYISEIKRCLRDFS